MHMNFAGHYQISLHRGCVILHFYQQGTRIPGFPQSHLSPNVGFCLADGWEIISHCSFSIYFLRVRLSIFSNVKETSHLGILPFVSLPGTCRPPEYEYELERKWRIEWMEGLLDHHMSRRRDALAKVVKQYGRERKQNDDHQRQDLSFSLWRFSMGFCWYIWSIAKAGKWPCGLWLIGKWVRRSQSSNQRVWACAELELRESLFPLRVSYSHGDPGM